MDNRISVLAVPNYDLPLLMEAVERHLQLLGVWDSLHPGMRVLLKPNLLAKHAPERAVTTHPALVEAVARVLQAQSIRDIALADSPGGPYTKSALLAVYQATGMADVAGRTGIHLCLETDSRALACPDAALCHTFDIIRPVADADYVINLCKLKTHAMTGLSAGVKNLFGCIPGLLKPEQHFRFPERDRFGRMLVDLSLLIKPGLTIADAVVSMEGDGPSAGRPRHTGLTFAARNPHALDLGLCRYIGLPAESVCSVEHAVRSGLCPASAGGLRWLGDGEPPPVPDFQHPASKSLSFGHHVPSWLRAPLESVERHLLAPRPVVVHKLCIGCGKCEESCAPRAIIVRGGLHKQAKKAVLDYSKCIRCYCCQEMCPAKAVKIRRTGLLRF